MLQFHPQPQDLTQALGQAPSWFWGALKQLPTVSVRASQHMDGNGQLGIFSYRWPFGESHASRKAEGGAEHVFPRSHKSYTVDVHWMWHFIQDISYPLHDNGQPHNPLKATLLDPKCQGYAWYIWLVDKTQEAKRSIQVERETRQRFSEICAWSVTNLGILSLRVFGLRETIYMDLG